jgi:hypothetical protein
MSKMELLEFITLETGKKLLIFNNYKFSFVYESQCDKIRWLCFLYYKLLYYTLYNIITLLLYY